MYFELYQDIKKEWRWRLRASNHKIIADSGESYVHKQGALDGLNLVKTGSAGAPIHEQ